jgi:uncharacterized membrane protein
LAILILSLPLLLSSKVRIIFLVFGTLTVFGPPELTTAKLVFFFGTMVALLGAFHRSRELAKTPAYSDLRPLLHASFGLALVVALSFAVAQFHGVSQEDWLKNVAPYALLAFTPLFAFDAQQAFTVRALRRFVVLAGLEACAVFTLRWYGRRDIQSDLTGGIGVPSVLLSGALFAFALAVALDGTKGRWRWLALSILAFALMVSSGTRLSGVLLAAPVAIVFGSRRYLTRRAVRLAIALPIVALLVTFGAHSVLKASNANFEAVSQRLLVLRQTGSTSDESYYDRLNQIKSAWALFTSEPVLGVGPGHGITWRDVHGREFDNPYVDPPAGFLPDFGLVGLAAVTYLVVAFVSVLQRLRRRAGQRTTAQLGLIGFGAIVVAYSVLQVPFEDKGLSVALLLLLALATREAAERAERRIAAKHLAES